MLTRNLCQPRFLRAALQIVASQDWPYVNRYEALVSAQPGTEEIIQNAEGMFR